MIELSWRILPWIKCIWANNPTMDNFRKVSMTLQSWDSNPSCMAKKRCACSEPKFVASTVWVKACENLDLVLGVAFRLPLHPPRKPGNKESKAVKLEIFLDSFNFSSMIELSWRILPWIKCIWANNPTMDNFRKVSMTLQSWDSNLSCMAKKRCACSEPKFVASTVWVKACENLDLVLGVAFRLPLHPPRKPGNKESKAVKLEIFLDSFNFSSMIELSWRILPWIKCIWANNPTMDNFRKVSMTLQSWDSNPSCMAKKRCACSEPNL